MVLFQKIQDIELQHITNHHNSINSINNYFLHRLASILCFIGYFIFGIIATTSLKDTYHEPLNFVKNLLFCIAFFGIGHNYLEDFLGRNTNDFFKKIDAVKRFEIYNILLIIYGILCFTVPERKYHMFTFYRAAVERPHINEIEIDGFLIILSHLLLGLSLFAQQYTDVILIISFSLYIFSYGMSFVFNMLTDSRSKYGIMFYAILFGSVFLTIAYSLELFLLVTQNYFN